jgi:hypothetical protein
MAHSTVTLFTLRFDLQQVFADATGETARRKMHEAIEHFETIYARRMPAVRALEKRVFDLRMHACDCGAPDYEDYKAEFATPAQLKRRVTHRHNPTIAERVRALAAGGFIAGQNGMLSSTGMHEEFVEAVFDEQQDFSRQYGHPERSRTGNVYGPVFAMFCGL